MVWWREAPPSASGAVGADTAEAGEGSGTQEPGTHDPRMKRLLCVPVLLCLLPGAPAPFPRSDPRSIFNPLIEPWWCVVPKFVRQVIFMLKKSFDYQFKDMYHPHKGANQ